MNTIGKIFCISLYGESHGKAVGVVIDGCPAGISLTEEDFAEDLNRRKAGAEGTTTRTESDKPILLSGVFDGHTNGAPIHIAFRNENIRSSDYEQFIDIPRPGHADFSAMMKFQGWQDPRGSCIHWPCRRGRCRKENPQQLFRYCFSDKVARSRWV